jgi:hypothetical protein
VEAVVVATAIAIASLLLVLELTFRHVHALVRETKQDGSHCTISAHAKLRGCGEVRVEITPPEPKRRARHR